MGSADVLRCMRLVSFDVYRAMGIPGVQFIKPEHYFREQYAVREADRVLFPEYWQVNSLLYGLNKHIFPSPATYHLGHNKIEQTRALLTVVPRHVPHTEILPASDSAMEQILDRFDFPFVAKVVRSSMGNGVYRIDSRQDLQRYLQANDILYVQEYLPLHRDLRVVWVGNQVLTAYWREQGNGFHFNVARGGVINFNQIPDAALDLVAQVATALGIDHAGFDIALVGDRCYILEFNVMFGLEGLNRQGIRYSEHVLHYLQSGNNLPTKPVSPRPIAA
jgi:ribosomal protein S6--L-glutamate ligase